eukprot:scaffold94753_cov48-Attheya_sp.AAC.1
MAEPTALRLHHNQSFPDQLGYAVHASNGSSDDGASKASHFARTQIRKCATMVNHSEGAAVQAILGHLPKNLHGWWMSINKLHKLFEAWRLSTDYSWSCNYSIKGL